MTKEHGSLFEGLCWFLVGLAIMTMIVKYAAESGH
jgi:hypothetical protein